LENVNLEPGQQKVTLVPGGFGYEVGDVVIIDTQKQPAPGDIVEFSARTNNSDCMAFGPDGRLARIIGIPGDKVVFGSQSYSANSFNGSTGYTIAIWGTTRYEDIAGKTLVVPDQEYLADASVGRECTSESIPGGSKWYSRFTVKKEAIVGVIVKKLGHDQDFEDRQKRIVY